MYYLVFIRKKMKLTQNDMSKLLGISCNSYANKELCKTEFTRSEMIKIVTHFKKTYPELTLDSLFFTNQPYVMDTCIYKTN